MKVKGVTFSTSSRNATRTGSKQSRKGGSTVSSMSSASSTGTAQRLRKMKLHLPHTALDEKSDVTRISHRRRRLEDSLPIVSFRRLFDDHDDESDNSPPATWLLVELAQKMGIKALLPLVFMTAIMLRISQPVVPQEEIAPYYLRVRAHRLLPNESAWFDETEPPKPLFNGSLHDMQENGTTSVGLEDEDGGFNGMNESLSEARQTDGTQKSKSNSWFGRGRSKRGSPKSMTAVGNMTRNPGSGLNESLSDASEGFEQFGNESSAMGVQDDSDSQLAEDGGDGFQPSAEANQLGDSPQGQGSLEKTRNGHKLPTVRQGRLPANSGRPGAQGNSQLNHGGADTDNDSSVEIDELGENSLESGLAATDPATQMGQLQGLAAGGKVPQRAARPGKVGVQASQQPNRGGVDALQVDGGDGGALQFSDGDVAAPQFSEGGVSQLEEEGNGGTGKYPTAMEQNGGIASNSGYAEAGSLSKVAQNQKSITGAKVRQNTPNAGMRGVPANPQIDEGGGDLGESIPTQSLNSKQFGGHLQGSGSETAEFMAGGATKQGKLKTSMRSGQTGPQLNEGDGGSAETQQFGDHNDNSQQAGDATSDSSPQMRQSQRLPAGGKGKGMTSPGFNSQVDEGEDSSLGTTSVVGKQLGDKSRGSASGTTKVMPQKGKGPKKAGGKKQQRPAEAL